MALTKGDVLLVPFPFPNLLQTKLRPAVVLWADPSSQDVTYVLFRLKISIT